MRGTFYLSYFGLLDPVGNIDIDAKINFLSIRRDVGHSKLR